MFKLIMHRSCVQTHVASGCAVQISAMPMISAVDRRCASERYGRTRRQRPGGEPMALPLRQWNECHECHGTNLTLGAVVTLDPFRQCHFFGWPDLARVGPILYVSTCISKYRNSPFASYCSILVFNTCDPHPVQWHLAHSCFQPRLLRHKRLICTTDDFGRYETRFKRLW